VSANITRWNKKVSVHSWNARVPVLANQPPVPCSSKLSWGVAPSSSASWPKLVRSVSETFFYILHKRASLGQTLQVPEQSFVLRRGLSCLRWKGIGTCALKVSTREGASYELEAFFSTTHLEMSWTALVNISKGYMSANPLTDVAKMDVRSVHKKHRRKNKRDHST
jgi:hypothetical protein